MVRIRVLLAIFLVQFFVFHTYEGEGSPVQPESNIPQVALSVTPLDLTRPPTREEIMAAGQLGGQLYPTHEISDQKREEVINLSFGEAIQEWNRHEYKKAITMFRKHMEEYPDSPWVSEQYSI